MTFASIYLLLFFLDTHLVLQFTLFHRSFWLLLSTGYWKLFLLVTLSTLIVTIFSLITNCSCQVCNLFSSVASWQRHGLFSSFNSLTTCFFCWFFFFFCLLWKLIPRAISRSKCCLKNSAQNLFHKKPPILILSTF